MESHFGDLNIRRPVRVVFFSLFMLGPIVGVVVAPGERSGRLKFQASHFLLSSDLLTIWFAVVVSSSPTDAIGFCLGGWWSCLLSNELEERK